MSFLRINPKIRYSDTVKKNIQAITQLLEQRTASTYRFQHIMYKFHDAIKLIREHDLDIKLTHPLYRLTQAIIRLQESGKIASEAYPYVFKALIWELQEKNDPTVGSLVADIVSLYQSIIKRFPEFQKGSEYYEYYLKARNIVFFGEMPISLDDKIENISEPVTFQIDKPAATSALRSQSVFDAAPLTPLPGIGRGTCFKR